MERNLDRSRAIAGLMGPVLVAMAAALLLNKKLMPELAQQMQHDFGIIFLSGILLLVTGLSIVRVHNDWAGGWPVLVTLLGWLAIIGGLARMLYFRHLALLAPGIVQYPAVITGAAVILLLVGVFLILKGYRLLD